jgi:hypothetical protein
MSWKIAVQKLPKRLQIAARNCVLRESFSVKCGGLRGWMANGTVCTVHNVGQTGDRIDPSHQSDLTNPERFR